MSEGGEEGKVGSETGIESVVKVTVVQDSHVTIAQISYSCD